MDNQEQKALEDARKEEELLKNMKPEVRVGGKLYRLRFDMYAFEQVEEEFGGLREAFAAVSGKSSIAKTVKKLFAILANSARFMDSLPEDVTGEELSHESIGKLKEVSTAIKAAMFQGMMAETADGGPASDKKENPLEKEYNAKNG